KLGLSPFAVLVDGVANFFAVGSSSVRVVVLSAGSSHSCEEGHCISESLSDSDMCRSALYFCVTEIFDLCIVHDAALSQRSTDEKRIRRTHFQIASRFRLFCVKDFSR